MLESSHVLLHIDLFPELTEEQLRQIVSPMLRKGLAKDALIGLLPNTMIPVVLRLAGLGEHDQASAIPDAKRLNLVRTLKDLVLTVSKLRPLKEAQVTAGGVNAEEIDPQSLQSKLLSGLYFAGEIIDVDGDSGGFNLQWAWSSGYVAGMNAS